MKFKMSKQEVDKTKTETPQHDNQGGTSQTPASTQNHKRSHHETTIHHLREEHHQRRFTIYRFVLIFISVQALIASILAFSSKKIKVGFVLFLVIVQLTIFVFFLIEFILQLTNTYKKLPAFFRSYYYIISVMTVYSTLSIVSGCLNLNIWKGISKIMTTSACLTLANGIALALLFFGILIKLIKNVDF